MLKACGTRLTKRDCAPKRCQEAPEPVAAVLLPVGIED